MIELSVLFYWLAGIVGAGLSTLIAFYLKRGADLLGVEYSGAMNERINEAIEYGLSFAAERLSQKGKALTKSVRNEFVTDAVNYVIKGVPGALTQFGITQARVTEMVEARLSGKIPDDPETFSGTDQEK